MKKLMAIFVLALFVAGMIPAAFAVTEQLGEDNTGDGDLTATDSGEIRENEIESGTAVAGALDTPSGKPNERLKDKIEKRRQTLVNAREKAIANKDRLVASKDNLLEKQEAKVAELIERCKENGLSEDKCNAQFRKRVQNVAALAPKFREKLQQFESNKEERIQKLKELKEDKVLNKFERGKEYRARVLDKAKIAKAQVNLVKAKERYREALAGLDKAKLRLEQAKTSKICKTAPESEECNKAREELRASAKEKLTKHADIILNSLESGKERVSGSEYLSEEEEAEAAAFFDEQIAKFTAIKTEIENAATKEEIVEAGKKLGEAWKEMKHKINAYLWYASNARIAGIVVKAEHLSAKLERVMERMAENGKDTSAVEPLVTEFKDLLETAKTKFKSAHSLLLEIKTKELTQEERKAKLDEANTLAKDAKKALQDANAKLREIFLKLKDTGATAELAEATTSENVEAEAEESAAEDQSENSEDDETESEETAEESGTEITADAVKYRSDYKPGKELGYFIWQGPKNVWTICASGDGSGHKINGVISADDGFCRTKPVLYEKRQDRYRIDSEGIHFRAWVGPHQDCLRFATASTTVSFDLNIDGESTNLVYFGPDKKEVGSPADLNGKAFAGCTASVAVDSGYALGESEDNAEISTNDMAVEEAVSDALDNALVEEAEEAAETA